MPRFAAMLVFALFAALLLTPAVAQTPQATPEATPVDGGLTGLVDGVTRQYSPDPELVPAENPEALSIITVHVFRFDSEDNAGAAYDRLVDTAADAFAIEDGPEIHEADLDDLGDAAHATWLSATNDDAGLTGHFRVLSVVDGEILLLLTAIAGSEDLTLVADDLAAAMVAREPGDGDTAFAADGTSTGGLWDLFPPADDPVLEHLVPFTDAEVTAP